MMSDVTGTPKGDVYQSAVDPAFSLAWNMGFDSEGNELPPESRLTTFPPASGDPAPAAPAQGAGTEPPASEPPAPGAQPGAIPTPGAPEPAPAPPAAEPEAGGSGSGDQ